MRIISDKELYTAAVNGFAMYGALAKQLMNKHGEVIVYEAAARMGEEAGVGSGERLKQGVEKFASQLLERQLAGGWASEVKVEGNKVVLKSYACPCYAGMRAGGLSYEAARRMCYSWWARFPDSARRVNPNVKNYWIEHYRSSESDYCLEAFELQKKV